MLAECQKQLAQCSTLPPRTHSYPHSQLMHGQVTRLTCSAQLGIKSRAGVSIPPDRFECKVKLKVEVLQLSGPVEVKIGLARLGSEWVAIPLLRDLGAGRAWRHALQGPFRVAHVQLNELAAVFADELSRWLWPSPLASRAALPQPSPR